MRLIGNMPWVRLSAVFAALSIALVSVRSITAPVEAPPTRLLPGPLQKPPEQVSRPEAAIQSFVLEIENRRGRLWHRVVSDHMTSGEAALANRIRGVTNKWTLTPLVGAKVGFAGGGGIPAIDPSFFLFDTEAQQVADLAGSVAWDSTNLGTPITLCVPAVTAPAIDVQGRYLSRFAIRLRTFSDSATGWEKLLTKNGDRVRVRFFGYVR